MLIVQHAGIDRETLWTAFEGLWPEVMVGDVGSVVPSSMLAVEDASRLAVLRRGIEPIRVIIPAQGRIDLTRLEWGEAMPVVI